MQPTRSSKNAVRRERVNGSDVFTKQYESDGQEASRTTRANRLKTEVNIHEHIARERNWPRRLGQVVIENVDYDQGTISTHAVPGKSFDEWITAYRRDSVRIHLRHFYLAGYWLRRFQGLDFDVEQLPPRSSASPADFCEYLEIRVAAIRQAGYSGISDAQWRQAIDVTRRLQEEFSVEDRRVVLCHNDYCPANIICSQQIVTPIDFEMTGRGSPLQDVAYFLHRLEMMPVIRPWQIRPWGAFRRSFLTGYGRLDAEQSPLYRSLAIRFYALRLLTHAKMSAKNWKQRMHNAWMMAVLKKRLLGALRD